MLGILSKLVYILTLGPFHVESSLEKLGTGRRVGNGEDGRFQRRKNEATDSIIGNSSLIWKSILEKPKKCAPEKFNADMKGQTCLENTQSFPTSPRNIVSSVFRQNTERRRQERSTSEENLMFAFLVFGMMLSHEARGMNLLELACIGGLYDLTVSIPGLILSGIFYWKSTDERLSSLFQWATWAFGITVGSSVAMCSLPSDSRTLRNWGETVEAFVVISFIFIFLIHVVSMLVGIVDLTQGGVLAAYYWWTLTPKIDHEDTKIMSPEAFTVKESPDSSSNLKKDPGEKHNDADRGISKS